MQKNATKNGRMWASAPTSILDVACRGRCPHRPVRRSVQHVFNENVMPQYKEASRKTTRDASLLYVKILIYSCDGAGDRYDLHYTVTAEGGSI